MDMDGIIKVAENRCPLCPCPHSCPSDTDRRQVINANSRPTLFTMTSVDITAASHKYSTIFACIFKIMVIVVFLHLFHFIFEFFIFFSFLYLLFIFPLFHSVACAIAIYTFCQPLVILCKR